MGWKEKEAETLAQLETTLNPEDWSWLQRNLNKRCGDLERAETSDLYAWFGKGADAKEQGINDTGLMRNYIWQAWIKVLAEEMPPIDGNLRSMWYQHIDPFWRKHGLLPNEMTRFSSLSESFWTEYPDGESTRGGAQEKAIAGLLMDQIGLFVFHRIFEYQGAFLFQQPLDGRAMIGREKPKFVFYTEKEGFWRLCERIYGGSMSGDEGIDKSITVMATKGQPSFVLLEYFAKELRKKASNIIVGGFSDHDPWGLQILENLDAKLRFFPFFKSVEVYRLTSPDLFTSEQLAKGKNLSKFEPAVIVDRWVEKTGGTPGAHGTKWSLHIDLLNSQQREAVAKKWLLSIANGTYATDYPRVEPIDLGETLPNGRFFT
jgi:hypothetical protein